MGLLCGMERMDAHTSAKFQITEPRAPSCSWERKSRPPSAVPRAQSSPGCRSRTAARREPVPRGLTGLCFQNDEVR